jgi:5'-nucleotidase
MLILVTNDDGVYSPGLQILAHSLKELGEVWVVAPDREQSAVSHSLTLYRPLLVEEVKEKVFAVNGTPTDCINLAVHGLLPERPALVVSGINKGGNLGDDVTYSGTVSAAFEAALMGLPAFAISQVAREDFIFQTAADFAVKLGRQVFDKGLPKDTLLNVNVPNLPSEQVKGARVTAQGRRVYGGSVLERIDPRGRKYYWISGDIENWEESRDADHDAVEEGYISVTPIRLDLTEYKMLDELRGWKEIF